MPTTFTTGTINQPDEGSVGLAMIEQIRDDLVAHPAWDLVEEFTPSGGSGRYYVFKCRAASSGLPSDFYVVFWRQLSNGLLRMMIAEDYNTGSKTLSHYCRSTYWQSIQFDNLGRLSVNYVLGSGDPNNGGADAPYNNYWTPSGTSTKWWLIIGDDFFTVAFYGANNGWMNAGVYTPMTDLPIAMPISAMGSAGTSSYGCITRNPAAADLAYSSAALVFQADTALGFAGDLRYNDALQGGQRPVAEVGMRLYENNTGDRAVYGKVLGKVNHMRTGDGNIPQGVAFGDVYVLEGKLWVPAAPTDSRIWDTGVASS